MFFHVLDSISSFNYERIHCRGGIQKGYLMKNKESKGLLQIFIIFIALNYIVDCSMLAIRIMSY